jgi:hypothetical protein
MTQKKSNTPPLNLLELTKFHHYLVDYLTQVVRVFRDDLVPLPHPSL